MSTEEILEVLQKFNLETLIFAFVTYLITCVIKKILPYNAKKIIPITPFILGVLEYFAYAYFLTKCTDYLYIFKTGLQIGGVATFYYAIIKQLSKSGNLQSTVSDILKGILKNKSVVNRKRFYRNNSDILEQFLFESGNISVVSQNQLLQLFNMRINFTRGGVVFFAK